MPSYFDPCMESIGHYEYFFASFRRIFQAQLSKKQVLMTKEWPQSQTSVQPKALCGKQTEQRQPKHNSSKANIRETHTQKKTNSQLEH